MNDTIQEWAKARASGGYKPLHPESEKNATTTVTPPVTIKVPPAKKWHQKIRWEYVAAFILLCGFVYWNKNKDKPTPMPDVAVNSPITETVEKVISKPLEPQIIYRDRPAEIIYRDSPPEIIYRDNPDLQRKYNQLEAMYRLRAKMVDDFNNYELKPGETRKLTFESSCPSFNNSLEPLEKYRQRLN